MKAESGAVGVKMLDLVDDSQPLESLEGQHGVREPGKIFGVLQVKIGDLLKPLDKLTGPGDSHHWMAFDEVQEGFDFLAGLGCLYDLDWDGDVDGRDLAELAGGFGSPYDASDLRDFALEFGENFCPLDPS